MFIYIYIYIYIYIWYKIIWLVKILDELLHFFIFLFIDIHVRKANGYDTFSSTSLLMFVWFSWLHHYCAHVPDL